MSDLFEGFVRKQFRVRAVRVNPLNIKEVAKACKGRIMHDGSKENQFSRDYIRVRVIMPLNDEQTKARIGDWVVQQGKTFKVFKDDAFRRTFEYPDGQSVLSDHEKYKREKEAEKKAPKPSDIKPKTPLSVEPAREQAEEVKSKKPEETVPEDRKAITLDELNKQ